MIQSEICNLFGYTARSGIAKCLSRTLPSAYSYMKAEVCPWSLQTVVIQEERLLDRPYYICTANSWTKTKPALVRAYSQDIPHQRNTNKDCPWEHLMRQLVVRRSSHIRWHRNAQNKKKWSVGMTDTTAQPMLGNTLDAPYLLPKLSGQ